MKDKVVTNAVIKWLYEYHLSFEFAKSLWRGRGNRWVVVVKWREKQKCKELI